MQCTSPLRVVLPKPSHLGRILKTLVDFNTDVVFCISPTGLKVQTYNSSQPTCLSFISVGMMFFDEYRFLGRPHNFEVGLNVESLLKVMDLCPEDLIVITFYPDTVIFSSCRLTSNPAVRYDVMTCNPDVECFKAAVYGDSRYSASLTVPNEDFNRILNCGKLIDISGTYFGPEANEYIRFSSSEGCISSTLVFGQGDEIWVRVNETFSFKVNLGPFYRSLENAQHLSPTVEFTITRTCLLLQFTIPHEDAYLDYYFTESDVDIRKVFEAVKSLY